MATQKIDSLRFHPIFCFAKNWSNHGGCQFLSNSIFSKIYNIVSSDWSNHHCNSNWWVSLYDPISLHRYIVEYPLLLLLSFCCHFCEYDIVFNIEFDKWKQRPKIPTRQIIILNTTMNKTTTNWIQQWIRQQQDNNKTTNWI